MPATFISNPNDNFRLGDFLLQSFEEQQWTEFRAAVAFVKKTGTRYIHKPLSSFIERGGNAIITAGVDAGGTTIEALEDVLDAMRGKGELFVFHNANSSTFHPKIYMFSNSREAKIAIGSTNLTEGGLFINYEANIQLLLNFENENDAALFARVKKNLEEWSNVQDGICYKVTPELIKQLTEENLIISETAVQARRKSEAIIREFNKAISLFKAYKVPRAPKWLDIEPELAAPSADDEKVMADAQDAEGLTVREPMPVISQGGIYTAFLMTLQKTDVGIGQTTSGTQRRSPEIFIPLICRDFDPEFWGWPDAFTPDESWDGPIDANGRGKMDRQNVMMRLAGDTFPVSIWYNPDKKDMRIRSEHLRSAGVIGDILYMERANGNGGFSYYVEIIPQGTIRHSEYLDLCTKGVRNSKKLWNYL